MRVDSLSWALCATCLCACATVSVEPGHSAVVMAPDGTFSVLGEGVTNISSDAIVDDFDLRQQTHGGTFAATTSDGVPVVVGDPIVNFALVAEELIAVDRSLGPDRWQVVVDPLVHSAICSVLASYRADQLDTAHLREAQARVTTLAAARLRPYHIVVESVELKGITPQLPELAKAIDETSVWEQRSIQAKTDLEIARHEADNLRAKAVGIAGVYASVAPTLDGPVLEEKENTAWGQLLGSPSSTVHVSSGSPTILEVAP